MFYFKGKVYKTVTGIGNALMKDCGATEHSMVKDGKVICRKGRTEVIAVYNVQIDLDGDGSSYFTRAADAPQSDEDKTPFTSGHGTPWEDTI